MTIVRGRSAPTGKRNWERAAPAILGALWMASFLLTLNAILEGRTFSPLYVAAAPSGDEYPIVTGFPSYMREARSGLEVGDRLRQLGEVDLRGAGPASFFVRYFEVAGSRPQLPIVYERDGAILEDTLITAKAAPTVYILALSLVWVAAALYLRLRFTPTGMVRAFFYGFMWQGLYFAANFFGSYWETWAAVALHGVCMTLVPPLIIKAFQRFPHGRPPTTAAARALPWLFAPLGVLHLSRFGFPIPPAIGVPAVTLGMLVLFVTVLGIVTRAYHREDPIGRRRLKWFLWGHYCALLPPAAGAVIAAVEPDLTGVFFATLVTLALVPLSLIISITRFNIADIDRVISATVSYNVLLALALLGGIALEPLLSQRIVALAGMHPTAGRALVSLALTAIVLPLHTRLRPRIEHQFFAARYAIDQGVFRLARDLAAHRDTVGLVRALGAGLVELFRPEACVVYGRDADGYAPVFVEGRAIPPVLDARGPLIATLRQRGQPLALARDGAGRKPTEELSPFDGAALETLDAEVLIPITTGHELALVVCLGSRLSGDVYTPTDVGLLATLGLKASAQLETFGQAELVRQGEAMQKALRRYVPSAVAVSLAAGREPPAEERQVTVLFVDIRGYTTLAEPRPEADVFATINRLHRDDLGCSLSLRRPRRRVQRRRPDGRLRRSRHAIEQGTRIGARGARHLRDGGESRRACTPLTAPRRRRRRFGPSGGGQHPLGGSPGVERHRQHDEPSRPPPGSHARVQRFDHRRRRDQESRRLRLLGLRAAAECVAARPPRSRERVDARSRGVRCAGAGDVADAGACVADAEWRACAAGESGRRRASQSAVSKSAGTACTSSFIQVWNSVERDGEDASRRPRASRSAGTLMIPIRRSSRRSISASARM